MRIVVIAALAFLATLQAQNWPSFRGPEATGVLETPRSVPTSWDVDSKHNVLWRTPIPGLGHSSPIVWADRIFVTTAISTDSKSVFHYPLSGQLDRRTDLSKHQFKLYCLDKRSGRVVWESLAAEVVPHTPATDGKRVVAFFASGVCLHLISVGSSCGSRISAHLIRAPSASLITSGLR